MNKRHSMTINIEIKLPCGCPYRVVQHVNGEPFSPKDYKSVITSAVTRSVQHILADLQKIECPEHPQPLFKEP